MKVAIVLGRGIEGCGVTKYSVELERWLLNNSYNPTIYASKDKKWSRNDAHKIKNLVHVRFDKDSFDEVYEGCRSSDIIIFNSLPSIGHSKRCQDNFAKLLNLSVCKILIQHDHNKSSLKRNALLQDSYEKSDILFAHSTTGDFADMVNTPNLFDMRDRKINLMQPGISFVDYEKYYKPISEQDKNHHKWIGRTARWKGYDLMFNFHNNYLKDLNQLTTLEGIEKSPVFIEFKNEYEFYDELGQSPEDINYQERYGEKPTVFSQYVNSELLDRLSKCGFGYQLSILDNRFIEKSLEFTHLEIVAVGAIPIFRKEYGDSCIHRYFDKPLTELDSGTVWLSNDNMEECKNLIYELSNDDILRDEYRHKAFEFYSHYDSKYVMDDLMKIVNGTKC
jgi:replicative DNA helicase